MFEDKTYDAIMKNLLEQVPDRYDKREGSFIWDALSPAALELVEAYIQLDLVLQFGFTQTTYGKYLEYRGQERGIERLPATKAVGHVKVTGQNGTIVPAGSVFSTQAGIRFVSTTSGTVGDEAATIEIEAEAAGSSGNVPAEAINAIPVSIPGITGVTNPLSTDGGVDVESDAKLKQRILDKARLPVTSGNIYHYTQWAKEVPGVWQAKVLPLWDGNGTVKVVILGENGEVPGPEVVSRCYEYIEERRPIGATVTVEAAEEVSVDVSVKVTLESGAVLT